MNKIMKRALCIIMAAVLLCMPVMVNAEKEIIDSGDTYVYYGEYISVGDGEYELSADYGYTIFALAPDETGKYTVTCSNGLLGIVSYNGMWVSIQPSEATITESEFSWECTGIGQEIWIAVTCEDAVANISVSLSESEKVVIEKIIYENKTTPVAFTYPGDAADLLNVSILNNNVDTAVLGDDGYYHLNSADGYILYANLSDATMSLYGASQYGQLKGAEYNDDGELCAIIDYNTAFLEYYDCADTATYLYPLTDDLIEMFKEVGANQGWYGSTGWVGGTKDDAWMYACYYTEVPFEEEVVIKLGDINGDDLVNSIDSNYLSRYIAGLYAIEAGSNAEKAADMNGDGKVNAIDGNNLKRVIAGVVA